MSNLLKETKNVLRENGKKPSDVVWVGCREFQIPISEFIKCADREYDEGFGAPHVAEDLPIVGSDFWLERHEYDGSEWWEYKELPQTPQEVRHIHRVTGGMWDTLEELNMKGVDDDI